MSGVAVLQTGNASLFFNETKVNMGIGIMKRVRNKLGKFFHKDKEEGSPMFGIDYSDQFTCGNCKFYQYLGSNGVIGICTHDKAHHCSIANGANTYGKPAMKSWFLAVMPHFHCGMNSYKAK